MITIRESYNILKDELDTFVMDEQKYLESEENVLKLLGVLKSIYNGEKRTEKAKDVDLRTEKILEIENSLDRWEAIKWLISERKTKEDQKILAIFVREVTIGLLYPKIDSHVSAQVNHLLKCPFNVHHETGKLSLPILDIDNFDVSKCPTILDALAPSGAEILEPYLRIFDAFCSNLVNKSHLIHI